MCPHFDGKYKKRFEGWLSDEERAELKYKVRTIGGHIVFPAHRRNGFTVSQARGINSALCDRFDLSLACIHRFYLNEESPITNTLMNHRDFFDLFVDFNGYLDFFWLQDFVSSKGRVEYSLPFDNFNRSPLPQTVDEYRQYTSHVLYLLTSRNNRILNSLSYP